MRRQTWLALLLAAGCLAGPGAPPPPSPTPPSATPIAVEAPAAFDVRVALIRRYDPGTNAGLPTAVTTEMVNETLRSNTSLTNRLADTFDSGERPYDRGERQALYRLVRQYRQIEVKRTPAGVWSFQVVDASNCIVTDVRGVYDDGAVRDVSTDTRTVPC